MTFLNWLKQLVLAFLSLCLSMALIMGVVYVYLAAHLPDTSKLRHIAYRAPLHVYTRDSQLIDDYGAIHRDPVSSKTIPDKLKQSFIAAEDHRFYQHFGVDFIGLVRAFKVLVQTGRKTQGASTITMQVARNFYLTREKTFSRKFKELLLALKIDQQLSKQTILRLYLNKIYLGEGAYGVLAAARTYYGKPLKALNIAQMAMLAGLPQAPSYDNPIRHPKRAKKRRDYVLYRMYQTGVISHFTYQRMTDKPITAAYHPRPTDIDAPYVAEAVRRVMVEHLGKLAYQSGLKVYTTINSQYQQWAQKALVNGLFQYRQRHGYQGPQANWGWPSLHAWNKWQKKLQKMPTYYQRHPCVILQVKPNQAYGLLANGHWIHLGWQTISQIKPRSQWGWPQKAPDHANDVLTPGDVVYVKHSEHWQLSPIPRIEGSFVAVNPHDGAISSLVGGFAFQRSHYIRPTQALRQPGSSFKPFIYSAALNKGYSLASVFNDAPVVTNGSTPDSVWRPENAGNHFYGPTRLRTALIYSRNLISIRLLQTLGIDFTRQFIKRFGFNLANQPQTLSLALGSGVTDALQLTRGFCAFANGGYKIQPHLIDHIEDQHGHIIYESQATQAYPAYGSRSHHTTSQSVITPANAYLIDNALHSVITRGTAKTALKLQRDDIAGKTGTTNQLHDAWFAGYHPDLVATVWVGYDEPKSIHEYGAQAALPIWIKFMSHVLPQLPHKTMPRPPDIVTARINPKNGQLASPHQNINHFELFRKDNLPNQDHSRSHESTQQSADFLF